MTTLQRFLPPLQWMPQYRRENLTGDLTAGLTVGVMLIPQGMAYALIAGLPPVYGLYAALAPLVIYALLGTSRQLAVGPVAMVSLLVAAGVAPLANGDTATYIGLALLLSLMVGVIQFVLGAVRFGFLTNFLSHPVLSGFTSAAALIIGFSQLKHLLGVDIPRSHHIHEIIWSAMRQIQDVHVLTLAIGVLSIALLIGLKKWKKTFPGALAAVVLATLAVWLFDLANGNVKIVGTVPGGLPVPSLPPVDGTSIRALTPAALTIALVGFMESIAVAKVYASKFRYKTDSNQELIALGAANIVGSVFQAYPTTGGFSRTAVNAQAGASTNLAALFSAGVIVLTLLFLTPLFYYLPNAVLAAIVMVAVFGLIDFKEMKFLWKTDRRDFFLMLITFVATLSLGIEQGILVGVIASLIVIIHQSSRPHVAAIGRLPGTETYRNVDRNPEATVPEGIAIVRLDASLYFTNTAFVSDWLQDQVRSRVGLKAIVIDAYPVNRVDSTAVHALKELVEDYRSKGIQITFAGVKGPVMDSFEKSGIADMVGRDNFFLEVHEAARSAEDALGLKVKPSKRDATTPAEFQVH